MCKESRFLYRAIALLLAVALLIPMLTACDGKGKEVVLLKNGSRWSITRVSFSDTIGSEFRLVPGYVFLQIDFKRISQESSALFDISGGDAYITDDQGNKYTWKRVASHFEGDSVPTGNLAFAVPENSHGFTLYFLDSAAIELGK